MNDNRKFTAAAGLGCALLLCFAAVGLGILLAPFQLFYLLGTDVQVEMAPGSRQIPAIQKTQTAIPTLTPAQPLSELASLDSDVATPSLPSDAPASLTDLYHQLNPGVVNIQVYVEQAGLNAQGAGSGFILDNEGHIITNHHVVAEAEQIAVLFFNQLEARAEVIGTDADSDLAVVRVDSLPESVHPLPLGDSSQVEVGEWVIAIGNPFGQQSSMSTGIVSAIGRTIPAGETPFLISEAIQTDAAINPGNSGGPLLNLQGEVVGINAQIAAGPARVNSGVGFAIPVNIARRVVPVLIQRGSYEWPWLGIQGGSVNLAIMQANDLETQRGAYIDQIVPDSPADEAGLQGSTDSEFVNDIQAPVGGDVVVAADGEPVVDFSDLLVDISEKNPGDTLEMTILRDGQRRDVTVELTARPAAEASVR